MNSIEQISRNYIQAKLDTIEGETDIVKNIADVLENNEDISENELKDFLKENFSGELKVNSLVKEWFKTERLIYLKLQVSKDLNLTSIYVLNATIYLYDFIKKYLK
jgi:hypothetical protein